VTTDLVLVYYITDRALFAGNEDQRRKQLLDRIGRAARCDVNFIQLREKDLSGRELEDLAGEAVEAIRAAGNRTRLLINSRTDIALAVGASGVHLRSKDCSPVDIRRVWRAAGMLSEPTVAVSCHSKAEVIAAKSAGADFAVFAPVFEKKDRLAMAGFGLEALEGACQQEIPVFALGGITLANAHSCLNAGAKGIAGIRIFQEGDLEETVSRLQALASR
jgi:thiamine-phosphate pyrophosphorylase